MVIQNVKGGYDFLPKEQKIREYINGILKETFIEYGYLPIETPILCYFDMLAGKYDEKNDILKEIYRLKDQGDRSLGLRYDLTVPFAKFIALNKNEIKFPFKRYEIAKVFRDGPVKVGRDREFTQCDVDVVGINGSLIEAELLSLYVSAFKKLDIEIIIKYNSRNLMRGLIKESGISEDLIGITITVVDKKNKLTASEFKKQLTEIGLQEENCKKLLEYFSYSLEELQTIFKDTKNMEINTSLQELVSLQEYLQALNINEYCTFDITLARGQDYYTGNVFEVYEKNNKISGSIGGGGRYDKMITDFINDGNMYPAVGISFGLTSIYELLKTRETSSNSLIDIFIIPMDTPKESLRLANDLRGLGLKIDLEMEPKKLKKSLDFANKEHIPYVIILGEDELKSGNIKVKDMLNNKEYLCSLTNFSEIKNIINK